MRAMTFKEMSIIKGGQNKMCFAAGVALGAALLTGNLLGVIVSGVAVWASC